MLNKKFVIKLALLTLVFTVAAFSVYYERLSSTISKVTETLVFPELASEIGSIRKITIKNSQGSQKGSFTIAPEGKHWKVLEKGGYLARDASIRETLLGLTELFYLDGKRKDPRSGRYYYYNKSNPIIVITGTAPHTGTTFP